MLRLTVPAERFFAALFGERFKTDVIAVTMKVDAATYGETSYEEAYYAFSATEVGGNSQPLAYAITPANGSFTTETLDPYAWSIAKTDTTYKFLTNGQTEKGLYVTNNNNGVRVGTAAALTISADGAYIVDPTTARYVGVYWANIYNGTATVQATPDVRCYTLDGEGKVKANIAGQSLVFWKLTTNDSQTGGEGGQGSGEGQSGATDSSTVKLTMSEMGYENSAEVPSITFSNGVTVTFAKGTNSNGVKYYNTGTAIRVYGGNTMTFTAEAGKTITEIVFTYDGSHALTADVGTYDGDAGKWTGNATTVVFTQGGTTGHVKLTTISVTTK